MKGFCECFYFNEIGVEQFPFVTLPIQLRILEYWKNSINVHVAIEDLFRHHKEA